MDCTHCHATGKVSVSGFGFGEIYTAECPACHGTKTLRSVDALVRRVIAAERGLETALGELAQTRTHIALYLHYAPLQQALTIASDCGALDDVHEACKPDLALAPNPSPWLSTWREYLERDAAKAPRKGAR